MVSGCIICHWFCSTVVWRPLVVSYVTGSVRHLCDGLWLYHMSVYCVGSPQVKLAVVFYPSYRS